MVTRFTFPHDAHWTWITSGLSLAVRLVNGKGEGISKRRHVLHENDLSALEIANVLFSSKDVDMLLEGKPETTLPLPRSILFRYCVIFLCIAGILFWHIQARFFFELYCMLATARRETKMGTSIWSETHTLNPQKMFIHDTTILY